MGEPKLDTREQDVTDKNNLRGIKNWPKDDLPGKSCVFRAG
jgi:hypothetical protein